MFDRCLCDCVCVYHVCMRQLCVLQVCVCVSRGVCVTGVCTRCLCVCDRCVCVCWCVVCVCLYVCVTGMCVCRNRKVDAKIIMKCKEPSVTKTILKKKICRTYAQAHNKSCFLSKLS